MFFKFKDVISQKKPSIFFIVLVMAAIIFSPLKKISSQPNISSVNHVEWSSNKTIYEVNLRQYTKAGTFKEFEKHLPRLKELGVGILWFMPLHPIGEKNRKGTLGSYYSVKDYLAVNPEFGTMGEFKSLVKKIHEMGMKVIIDWVANHTAWDNNLINEHPDWFTKDSLGKFLPPVADWQDVVDLNYDNKDLRKYMIEALKFWIEKCDIDGYRCDVAGMVPTDFWIEARKELDKIKPVFMLAEWDSPELHQAFDMTYDWKVYKTFNAIAKGEKNLDSLRMIFKEDSLKFPDNAIRMEFTSNHDENTWNGTVFERLGKSVKTFAAFTFLIPGMPLIYSGQEAAMNKRLDFFEKDLINWDDFKFEDFYKTLVKLKKENKALLCGSKGGKLVEISSSNKKEIFAFVREKGNEKIFAVFNFSDRQQNINLNGKVMAGDYSEVFTTEKKSLKNYESFSLRPWEFKIFIK
ncbi:MAG: alpha-amylase family glycosyl hydrolase [Ignavibacteriaceae bacterium]